MNSDQETQIDRRGLILVLSSPSGAGKTTLANHLLASEDNLELSISATTRPARPGETDGKDYFFYDIEKFDDIKDNNGFLEWAQVFDNYYGTPRKFVTESLDAGKDILFDIDWQGCSQLTKVIPNDIVTVFILPPSAQALETRLKGRGQDSESVIKRRMSGAHNEICHYDQYQYVIINNDIQESLAHIQSILRAERLKRTRQHGLVPFVTNLLSDLS